MLLVCFIFSSFLHEWYELFGCDDMETELGELAIPVDGFLQRGPSLQCVLGPSGVHAPDHQREVAAAAVLLGAAPAVCLVFAALLNQRGDSLGAHVDLDEGGFEVFAARW